MNKDQEKYIPWVTFALAAVNVLAFIIVEFIGDSADGVFMEQMGALFIPDVVDNHQYYRLFTAMFLHFGFGHLLNNMFMLLVAGNILERAIGHLRFAIIYITAGLCGAILTMSIRIMGMEADDSVIAGASGAIFGIMGGLFALALHTKGKYQELSVRNMIIMLALALYLGFVAADIDVWGHAGGLAGGILIGYPLIVTSKRLKSLMEKTSSIDFTEGN